MALIIQPFKRKSFVSERLEQIKKAIDVEEVHQKPHNPNLYPLHSFAFSVP